jgi:pseudouridine synthase
VSDPEGRPTVMKFFEKMHERLYPVGRLDYQSEGLLLMTNDGELANLLTKAGSGVEKTYLVKVAGRPTEEELEKLRSGVMIERAEEGSERVRSAPARVRQVRVGDNPWFEVVLIEGRNRELRKMFGAVGHFVEKIRRVGYGPLALDVEPGKMRELTPDEVRVLRLTAEGKMKPKRLHADRMLPKDAGLAAEKRAEKRGGRGAREFGRREGGGFPRRESGAPGRGATSGFEKREGSSGAREGGGFRRNEGGGFARREGSGFRPRESGGFAGRENKPFSPRSEGEPKREFRPRSGGFSGGTRGAGPSGGGERSGFGDRREGRTFSGEKRSFGGRPGGSFGAGRGAGKPGDFRERPKFEGRKPFTGGQRPFGGGRATSGPKPEFRSAGGDRPRFDRPRFGQGSPDKPQFDKPRFERRSFDKPTSGKLHIERVESETRSFDRPPFDKPRFEKPGSGGRPGVRREGGQGDRARKPFRPQGDRPGGFKRPSSPGGGGRPKTGFGGRPGGFGKSSRPGGGGRSGPRSAGGRPGGRFGGSKRG